MKSILQRALVFLSLGIIFSSISETLFYAVDISLEYPIYFLIYGLYGYAMLLLIYYYKISHFAGFFIAACAFGFLIEGAFIGILYEALPFSLIWTSISWHTLITVVLFFYYFRKIMLSSTVKNIVIYNVFLGMLLGLWGTYSWSAIEGSSGEVLFNWVTPEVYIKQLLIGYILFVIGHIIYDFTSQSVNSVSKKELYSISGIVFLSFVIGNGFLFFPISLILPILIIGCVALLQKSKNIGENIMNTLSTQVPIIRYIFTLCIPLVAGAIYTLFYIYQIEIEMNALYFVIGGVISLYMIVVNSYKILQK